MTTLPPHAPLGKLPYPLPPSKTSGIYIIRNLINGKQYVGSSTDIRRRWKQHRTELRRGKNMCGHLQRAWNSYGEKAFEFRVLEVIENPTQKLLIEREQYYFDTLQPEYNILKFAYSGLGATVSEETKARISKKNKGRPISDAQREHLRQFNMGRKRTPEQVEAQRKRMNDPEVRKRQSEKMKGRVASEATKAKMSATQKEVQNRPEVKEHQRQVHMGKTIPREAVERCRQKRIGQKRTPEQRERIRQGHLNYTPEQRERMRQGQIKYLSEHPEVIENRSQRIKGNHFRRDATQKKIRERRYDTGG